MAYGDFKYWNRRTPADNILRVKAFSITEDTKHDGCQRGITSMVYKFFDRQTSGAAATLANESSIKNKDISNKELAEELHKAIITKFNRRQIHSPFMDNIYVLTKQICNW